MIHTSSFLLLERDEAAVTSGVLEVLGAAWHLTVFFETSVYV